MQFARTKIVKFFIACCFSSTALSIPLNCNFYTSGWGNAEGLYYTCQVNELSTESPNILVDRVLGNHIARKSNDDVKHWLVDNSPNMLFMPQGIGGYFQNLEEVYIRNAGLQKITQSDLMQFSVLEQLFLIRTQLKTLESGLFLFNPKLRLLNLSNNQINSIAPDVLSPLKNLRAVSLRNNACIDIDKYTAEEVKEVVQEIIEKCQNRGAALSASSEAGSAAIFFPKVK